MSLSVGTRGEIRPAYEMDTGEYSGLDEVALCAFEVVEDRGGADVKVLIPVIGEVFVHRSRLRVKCGAP